MRIENIRPKMPPIGQSAWEKDADRHARANGLQTAEDFLNQPLAERDPVEGLTLKEFMDKYHVPGADQIKHGYRRIDGRKRLVWLINDMTPEEWERAHSKDGLPRWHH